jgi:DNA mismatch repair ATPase MutS
MTYLQSTVFRLTENNVIEVNRIVSSPPSSYMRVTPLALRSLHIFNEEHHPLIAKGTGGSKEGFSLFSLLDRCDGEKHAMYMRSNSALILPMTRL